MSYTSVQQLSVAQYLETTRPGTHIRLGDVDAMVFDHRRYDLKSKLLVVVNCLNGIDPLAAIHPEERLRLEHNDAVHGAVPQGNPIYGYSGSLDETTYPDVYAQAVLAHFFPREYDEEDEMVPIDGSGVERAVERINDIATPGAFFQELSRRRNIRERQPILTVEDLLKTPRDRRLEAKMNAWKDDVWTRHQGPSASRDPSSKMYDIWNRMITRRPSTIPESVASENF